MVAKAMLKWFAELNERFLLAWKSIEQIKSDRFIFGLSLSRFVVHEDKIRYRNRTLSCRFGGSPAQERYSIRNLLLGMTIYFSD
jgi:hypothetical protein